MINEDDCHDDDVQMDDTFHTAEDTDNDPDHSDGDDGSDDAGRPETMDSEYVAMEHRVSVFVCVCLSVCVCVSSLHPKRMN